jgi:outer membrane protein OmpA-like peptidoglycan-associated protein
VPIGDVHAALHVGHVIYVGGRFGGFGPRTGALLRTKRADGMLTAAWPVIPGEVTAIAPLPDGGAIIGGRFALANGTNVAGLRRIDSAGKLRPGFLTSFTSQHLYQYGNEPTAVTVVGNVVYVAGAFDEVNGTTRYGLAAVSLATGALLDWQPQAYRAVNWPVTGIAQCGTRLFISGEWKPTVSSATTWDLVAFDSAGNVLEGTVADGRVTHIACAGSTLYVAGAFQTIGGVAHHALARVSGTDGTVDTWAPTLDLSASYGVEALTADGAAAYVGLSTGGSAPVTILRVDAATAAIGAPWTVNARRTNALALDGATLYVGAGSFNHVGDFPGAPAVDNGEAIDTRTGVQTGWHPLPAGTVRAVAVTAGGILVGGDFNTARPVRRTNLAALDDVTGQLTAWQPAANGDVDSLAASSSSLYVAGAFTTLAGAARDNLGAVSLTTGAVTAFAPAVHGADVVSLSGQTLYVGGVFATANGAPRSSAAAFRTTDGSLTSWAPEAKPVLALPPAVTAIAATPTRVYLAGYFASVGADPRTKNLAAVNPTTGAPLAWYPPLMEQPQHLLLRGSSVVVGGYNTMSVVNGASGAATAFRFDPRLAAGIGWQAVALASFGRSLYALGDFGNGGVAVAADATTGAINPWRIQLNLPPSTPGAIVALPGGLMAFGHEDAQVYGYATETSSVVVPSDILFASGSAKVRAAGVKALRKLAPRLVGAVSVTCTGHTDSVGSAAANVKLGLARARAACAILVPKGSKVKVVLVSKGESQPVASNATAAGRARNRRVEIRIVAV